MNADLKRVREAGVDEAMSPAKRRALSLSTPGPVDNSEEDKLEDWMKVVESKRKEAIYRQMLEYRRLHESEVQRTNELEAQRRVLEASVQAVEVCWTQLVNGVRDLAGRQDLGSKQEDAAAPMLDPRSSNQELNQALQTRLPLTQQLIRSFVNLVSKDGVRTGSSDHLHSKCNSLQAEASISRSNTHTLQSQISSLTESRDRLQRDLQRTQKSLDRQRMEHDKAEKEWMSSQRERDSATPGVGKPPNGSGNATPNGRVEEDVKPFDHFPGASTGLLQDTTELEQQIEARSKQLDALRQEHTMLQQEHDRLRLLALHPLEATLRDSPFFQIYLQQLSTLSVRAGDLQQRSEASEEKLDELRSNNFEFREAVLAEARAEAENLRQQMTRKDADLARLRGQRDDVSAELTERKARETEKMRFADQIETLATARQERITFLASEVTRLKGKLGAASGSQGYLDFLRGDGGIDGDYLKSLEAKISDSDNRLAALSTQLQEVGSLEVAEVQAELESTKVALAKYETVFGPNPEASEGVRELGEKLRSAVEERSTLQLKLSEAEAATDALYSEVEGMSKLWEGMEQTVRSKVFELKDGELKMSRLATEKAKADNKYFQAMRAKETIEAENKTFQRSIEKQAKLLERAQEVERSLNTQIAAHEKGLTALKNSAMELQNQLALVTSEKGHLEARLQQAQTSLSEAQQIMQQRIADHATEKATREKLQEEVESANRTIKKLKERQEAMTVAGSNNVSANEFQITEERDKLWKVLRCSCCQQNLKAQVITTCFHTFCKQCLDQRIASRQRKCPACGQAFAKEDISTLYWQ